MKKPANTPPRPPKPAAWLIQRLFPDSGECSVLGDMIETYRYVAKQNGSLRARLWFWGQCLRAVPVFACERIYWRSAMLKNYILITLRNLQKNKLYSFLNGPGFSGQLD